ncbi:MAG: lipoprotein [Betaproteobacteria bacterium]
MRRSAFILFALLACFAVTGCGQKGPLKLPPPASDSPKSPAAAGQS